MTAPPILEVYVLWHPDDDWGSIAADRLISHFHGPAYSGLAGGAVEVYIRSAAWDLEGGPPRPLPFVQALPENVVPSQLTVVVPVLGRALARAVRDEPEWRSYIEAVFAADASPDEASSAIVIPAIMPGAQLENSVLYEIAGRLQAIYPRADDISGTFTREVVQAIAQRLAKVKDPDAANRITVFVSHTKHSGSAGDVAEFMVGAVRNVLDSTHLGSFFDASEIQATDDWKEVLVDQAGHNAMLMVRTDQYSGREWTQREVLAAKINDLPIVCLYAVRQEELRGSFLMDHVPVVACPPGDEIRAIEIALGRLVDEALKRALWEVQRVYLVKDGFDWLPVHAPEPLTLIAWLSANPSAIEDSRLVIMHPDPPLGPPERKVILDLCELAGTSGELDILTPRTYATRGGRLR